MKFLISFLVLILGFEAQALTRGQFVGPYGIIRIVAKDFTGAADSDGQILFEAMDVPQKDSILGPGKVIEPADRGLQFICANRPQIGYECSIFIHQKGHGSVNSLKKTMQYKVLGDEANVYGKLFKTDANGEFHFISVDGLLKVNVGPGLFEVLFQQVPAMPDQGLVIVNVEDTLKISHIQNFWDSLNYNTDTKKRFMGMSTALQLLARSNPTFRFIYLTRGTELVAGKAEREFVLNNKFPRGEFRTYSTETGDENRKVVLRKLLSTYPVKRVVLIGHNGSPDPEVFRAVSLEFKDISFISYVHVVYSTSSVSELGMGLFPEQTGYVTAVELVADWQQKGLTDMSESLQFMSTMVNRVIMEDPEVRKMEEFAIPPFVNCDDFQWRWSIEGDYQVLAPLRDHLVNRCHMQAPLAGYRAQNEN